LNASIQCLSHTPIFREYFTTKAYLNDINTTNPLGHQGRLAQVSAVLINSLWKKFNKSTTHPTTRRITAPGSYVVVSAPSLTPKTFKESLGKFNEHFQGNEQHDAQELLAFLLGGLSEDLNRIVDKPYIEAPDSDGRPDSELADIWWSNHLKREMSVIVALFTGQYKSLLTCRTCKYESARFEPFSFLQLPLPEDDQLSVSLLLYPLSDTVPITKYCVRVRADGKLGDVLLALAKVLTVDEGGIDTPSIDITESKSTEEVEASLSNELYVHRASNLAVVDMREGYIARIAPVSIYMLT
jgi:ubiquitin carboxyl-terminal hydrolase 6/32